jgi:hypothetical protein
MFVGEIKKLLYHLNSAGIVVILTVNRAEDIRELTGNEKNMIVYENEDRDIDEAVSFIKKLSSYDYESAGEALYI